MIQINLHINSPLGSQITRTQNSYSDIRISDSLIQTEGETFFICWILLPADLKNWDFQKKKKKKILPDITTKFLVSVSLQITEKIIIWKHHTVSVN